MKEETIRMQAGSPSDAGSVQPVESTESTKSTEAIKLADSIEPAVPIDPYWLTPEGLCLLRGWTRDGFSEAAIARKLAVPLAALQAWRQQQPKLAAALKQGREVCDYMMEEAVFRAGLGFKVSEEEEKTDAKGGFSESKKTKYVPTTATLAMFWLKARRPDKWGDLSAEAQDDAATARSLESFHKALLGILPESFTELGSDAEDDFAADSRESSAAGDTLMSSTSGGAFFAPPGSNADSGLPNASLEASAVGDTLMSSTSGGAFFAPPGSDAADQQAVAAASTIVPAPHETNEEE